MWTTFFFALSVIGLWVAGWCSHLHQHVHSLEMLAFSTVFALWAILWKEQKK